MTNNNSDDPLEGMSDDFDINFDKIEMEELSKPLVPVIVPLFKAFLAEGLSPAEAAAITMAVIIQGGQQKSEE